MRRLRGSCTLQIKIKSIHGVESLRSLSDQGEKRDESRIVGYSNMSSVVYSLNIHVFSHIAM